MPGVQPSTRLSFMLWLQVHSGAKRKSNRSSSSGPIRQIKTPPQAWSSPAITSPPPQDETDSKQKVRLYLSEGPVRILSAHVSLLRLQCMLAIPFTLIGLQCTYSHFALNWSLVDCCTCTLCTFYLWLFGYCISRASRWCCHILFFRYCLIFLVVLFSVLMWYQSSSGGVCNWYKF